MANNIDDFFRNSNVRILDFLLKEGVDINVKSLGGNTRLHNACINKEYDVITFLIENGADLETLNDRCETAFFVSNDEKVWQMLKDAGANVDATDINGSTAVMRYATTDMSKVKFLISLGVDTEVSDNNNMKLKDMVKDASILKSRLETIKLLISGLSREERNELLKLL